MKTIYLPYAIEKIVKILSYVAVILLDIVHFVLTPITWIQFKAHVFMISAAGISYTYMHFFKHYIYAAPIAITGLAVAILSVVLIKYLRKKLNKLRQTLMRIAYSPIGVCFVTRPLFTKNYNYYLDKIS